MSDNSILDNILGSAAPATPVAAPAPVVQTVETPVVPQVSTPKPSTPVTAKRGRYAPVEGKTTIDSGTPNVGVVHYPKGYLQVTLGKYAKVPLYRNQLMALKAWMDSADFVRVMAEADGLGFIER
jgi:hypothetical protein